MKSEIENVALDVLCEEHLHSACRRRTSRRHVKDDMPKTLMKFTLVSLRHDGHI